VITGEGLVLRPPHEADHAGWLDLYADPDEIRFGLPAFVPLPDTDAMIAEVVATARRRIEAGEPASFVIADADDDRFLGSIGWRQDAPPLQIADIGYGVHPAERGKRVATRAVRLITRWLTRDEDGPHLPRVQLDHSTENTASCRTAIAAGFEQEGVRRHYLALRDPAAPDGVRRHDVCLHGYVAGPTA
jgi:RimJ/RimL family protein N-acetyltransferase